MKQFVIGFIVFGVVSGSAHADVPTLDLAVNNTLNQVYAQQVKEYNQQLQSHGEAILLRKEQQHTNELLGQILAELQAKK